MANVTDIMALIDNARANGAKQFNGSIITCSKGCNKLLKGRGANSIKNKLGVDLDTITKTSTYEMMIGDIDYAQIKEANGYGSEVNNKTGKYSFVKGYEGIIALNETTGEYQLRCFIDPTKHKHLSTVYTTEDCEVFNPNDEKYAEYRRTAKPVDEAHKNDVMVRYIGLDKIMGMKL